MGSVHWQGKTKLLSGGCSDCSFLQSLHWSFSYDGGREVMD